MHSLSDGMGQNSTSEKQFKRVPEGFDMPPAQATKPVLSVASERAEPIDWLAQAKSHTEAMTGTLRDSLAGRLRLPVESLDVMPSIGYSPGENGYGGAFTFPESLPTGAIVGLATLCADGKHRAKKGGKRGLTLPSGWRDRAGPVFVVFTPGDAIALSHAGLCAVAAPDNRKAAKLLTELLAGSAGRDVVILAPSEGADLASVTAQALSRNWGRPVLLASPPEGSKDVRHWLTHEERAGSSWADRGAELAGLLVSSAERIGDGAAEQGQESADTRPVIVGPDEGRVVDECVAVLAGEADLFQKAGGLVFLSFPARPAGQAARPEMAPATEVSLRTRLTRRVTFVKLRQSENQAPTPQYIHPPAWCAKAVLQSDRPGDRWPGIRPLTGVLDYPVMLPDGELVIENGYHTGTGLYVWLPPGLSVLVPPKPSRDDVTAAVGQLCEVVRDSLFQEPCDLAAFLAMLLTPLARSMFVGVSPFFLAVANTRGSGKTTLAEIVCAIATGKRLAALDYPADEKQLQNLITAVSAAGARIAVFDNLVGTVGGRILDRTVTSPHLSDRPVHSAALHNAENDIVWIGTANSPTIRGDTARRTVPIRLHSPDARPERRGGYKYPEIVEHVLAHRGELLAAGFTILRAWVQAGCPSHGREPMASFTAWDRVVRGAILWAGLSDPLEAIEDLKDTADETETDLEVILEALATAPELAQEVSAGGVRLAVLADKLKGPAQKDSEPFGRLRAAANERGHDHRTAAKWIMGLLRGKDGLTYGGWKLEKSPSRHRNGYRWRATRE